MTAVPEDLEFEPFVHGHRVRAILYLPKYLIGQAAIGLSVPLDLPIQWAVRLDGTTPVFPTRDVRDQAIVAGGLPLEDCAPVLGRHLFQQIRLELEPETDVHVALFPGRPQHEDILGVVAPPLLEFAVKGSGRVPVTPRDRLDSVN